MARKKSTSTKTIETTGSYLDIRLAILRTDLDPEKHGDTLSFWAGDEPCFQDAEGNVGQDFQAALGLFGFDEPHDGMAVSMAGSQGGSASLYGEDTDELEADLVKLLHKHFVPDDALAKAIAGVVSTAWGFGCDYDEVRDEALENLTEFKWSGESGSDQLITADVEFPCGGAILVDAVLCSDIPAKISPDGSIEFADDLEWDDFRGDRFILVLAPQFKTKIQDAA